MNNKVKKRKHLQSDRYGHRYNHCLKKTKDPNFLLYCGLNSVCRCGKKRPLNNKVEGGR